jgi:hypothetical protein
MGAIEFFISLVEIDDVVWGRMQREHAQDLRDGIEMAPVSQQIFAGVGGGFPLGLGLSLIFIVSQPLFDLGIEGGLLLLDAGIQMLLPVDAQVNGVGDVFETAKDVDGCFFSFGIGSSHARASGWGPLDDQVFWLAAGFLAKLTNDLHHNVVLVKGTGDLLKLPSYLVELKTEGF